MTKLLELFEQDQRRRGLQPNTLILRNRQLALYEREVGRLDKATGETIETWLDGRGITSKTRSCYLTTFSSFYKFAVKHDHLAFDPTVKIDRPKVHAGMPNPIPEDALERALSKAKPMMRCWLALEGYAGLRCQEVAYLSHEDISSEGIRVLHGKGGKERFIPALHPEIVKALDKYKAPTTTGRLWPTVTPASVSQMINRYLHGLGIVHSAHKLRHRFGTVAYKASGQDILVTQRLLGHSDPKTTSIYAQVSDENARKAVLGI